MQVFVIDRFEQLTEWSPQTADEGPVCGTLSDSPCSAQFSTPLLTHADGSSSLCLEWFTDTCQSGLSLTSWLHVYVLCEGWVDIFSFGSFFTLWYFFLFRE